MGKNNSGFTLLEILLVVAAIAILAGIVIVAINPGKQLGATRNAARQSDVSSILNAVYQYSLDNSGLFPPNIDTNLRMLGTNVSGCGVICGPVANSNTSSQSVPVNFADINQTTFAGTYTNSTYNTNNSLINLSSNQITGTYTSDVKDSAGDTTWATLAWVPNRPTGKPLPNNAQSETAYPTGNANMTGDVLLMHLDESSGATSFADNSGSNNNGSCANPNCPTMATGKLGNAPTFSAGTNPISIPHSASLNLTNQFTLGAWFYQIATSSWTSYGHLIGKGVGFSPPSGSFSISGNSYWRVFLVDPVKNSYQYQDGTWIGYNSWQHMVFTFDNGTGKIYLNGSLLSTKIFSFTSIRTNNLPVQIGYGQYNGLVDEVIIFNRPISATEVADIYKRGALSLKHQVRSCVNASCSDGTFVGPDGTAKSYYSEANNNLISTPSISLTNISSNRYFQYKSFLDSPGSSITPELKSVAIGGTQSVIQGGGNTPSSTIAGCLDLSPTLSPTYITSIPFDPKTGSNNQTYYAIQKTSNGRVNVQACSAENNEVINVTR